MFGGTVWTWNTATNQFDAEDQASTANPPRQNNKGPVYKFENVGTVTNNCGTNTSDYGGIWVIGDNSNVTSSLGQWAGSILVEDFAVATVNYSTALKGTEPDGYATVWTNGTLTIGGNRTNFNMNDGTNQRWYIGENGVINTTFNAVTKGDRLWEINIVVADAPERDDIEDGVERIKMQLTKQVMTWSADISSNINSITAWYKAADGTLTKLEDSAITHDATGISVTYEGFDYNYTEKTIRYTIHSNVLNEDYTGTYVAGWAGDQTVLPTFAGLAGYSLDNIQFSKNDEQYTLTADITFPFPVSKEGTENVTGIESALGQSKWFVNDEDKIVANNAGNSTLSYSTQDSFKWYIYPSFNEGTFSFKIKHHSGKYIPTIAVAQSANTQNAVVEEEEAGTYYFTSCIGGGNGFSINPDGTVFLTINSNGRNQYIWTWTKTGNSHYGSNLSFPNVTITMEDVKTPFDQLKNVKKFEILEGSTVVGPNEFANPTEINAAIDAAQQVNIEDATAMEAFCNSAEGQKIRNYLNQVAQYGTLFNYQLDVTRPYNTLILPCPATRPAGMTLYSCSATENDGTTLVLSEVSDNIANNVPYIIKAEVGSKYTIIGWLKGHQDTHTSGWLTGVLKDGGALVPAESYALATNKETEKQAFYLTDGTVTCPQTKCYITPTAALTAKALYFENSGATTSIEEVFGGNDGKMEIYDLAGRRIQSIQKGVNIVNGRKVLGK